MKIGKFDIECFFSTKALGDIESMIGGTVETLADWLMDENITTGTRLKRTTDIIMHLANGAVLKNNQEIKRGLKTGEIQKPYEDDFFAEIIGLTQLNSAIQGIFDTIHDGSDVIIPDGMHASEEDDVLAEIEEIKNQ